MKEFIVKKKVRKETEQFTCRIEVDLLKEVRSIVLENNLDSVNQFINDCLRFALDNMKLEE